MDSEEHVFDTVKFEKMKAREKYNRFRKIRKLLHVFEVLVALTLISWSSTYLPQAFKVSGKFLFKLADYVFKPHVVFLIGNAIVVALVVLCREKDDGDNDSSGSGDIYDDYTRHSQAQQQRKDISVIEPDKSPPTSPVTEKMSAAGSHEAEERQIVYVSPVEEKLNDTEEEKKEIVQEENSAAVATGIDGPTKEKQKFQRTQSARLKRETATMPGLELRRSETYRRGASTSFESVDSLSNDEFNLAVAAFIKRHQEFLLQQKLAENEGL